MAIDWSLTAQSASTGEPALCRTLVIAGDGPRLEPLLHAAAAAGADVQVCADAGQARVSWPAAPLVLVGADRVADVIRVGLPRRHGVIVVTTDPEDPQLWRQAVALGAESVLVLPDAEASLIARLADATESAGVRGRTVGVIGGRGGAGASTLAAALALAGARAGLPSWLVDADPYGGGLDLVLGGEELPGLRWRDLAGTTGRVSAPALRQHLPGRDGVHLVSWDRGTPADVSAEAMHAVVTAARRTGGLVVIDVPRAPGGLGQAALDELETALVVVPAEVRAAVAAARVAAAVAGRVADVRVVVRGPAPAGLPARAVADALGLPLAGQLRPEPRLAADLERGVPPGRSSRSPLRRFSDALVSELFAAERRREPA